MSKIGSGLAAGTNTVEINFIPEYLTIGQKSGGSITSLLVEADDYGVILNLDQVGVQSMGKIGFFNYDTSTNYYRFRLANCKIPLNGNSCRITIVNVTESVNVYQRSESGRMANPLDMMIARTTMTKVLAGSEQVFKKFTYLGFDNAAITDNLTLTYNLGEGESQPHVESQLAPEQLEEMYIENFAGAAPNLEGGGGDVTTPSVLVNDMAEINMVSYIPTADEVIYLQRWQGINEISDL